VLGGVYEELAIFTAGRRSEDDITLVVVKIDGLPPAE
jgi:serine phosphatase RsbU (regulator of sigma subunit)